MKLIIIFSFLTLAASFGPLFAENTVDVDQVLQDIELAARMGSGESVTINLNATEGLEGKIAYNVQEILQKEAPHPLSFTERLKIFFHSLFF